MPRRNPGTPKYERGNATLLTVEQAKEELGISEYMIRLMLKNGTLRCVIPGKKIVLIPRIAIDEMLRGEKPNS